MKYLVRIGFLIILLSVFGIVGNIENDSSVVPALYLCLFGILLMILGIIGAKLYETYKILFK